MFVTTSAEMRTLDRLAAEDFGLPTMVLMENAARSVVLAALDFWPELAKPGRRLAVLAGPGQNGGDGWALARWFTGLGHRASCFLIKNPGQEIRGDAAVNFQVVQRLGLNLTVVETAEAAAGLTFEGFDLVVDAVFGTGLTRPLGGPAAAALSRAGLAKERLGFRSLAVDLPSGLSSDTGRLLGPALPADLTVTLGAPKIGLYLNQGPDLAGRVAVGDLGLTPAMLAAAPPPRGRLIEPAWLRPHLPGRPAGGHKGVFGHVLAAGGAAGHTGALVLAALGAGRSGAALVTALHPASLGTILENKLTEAMTRGLPEEAPGQLAARAAEVILALAENKSALALGPGLGLGEGAAEATRRLAGEMFLPTVFDADALTHLAGRLEILRRNPAPKILTPHPGEAGRLLGQSAAAVQDDRLGAARRLADQSGAIVVLKGRHTVVAEPGGAFLINTTGGPHLAVGGSGDLLTGLCAGLLAQQAPPLMAAALAVWVHGRAGDLAAAARGPFGLTPEEFAWQIPHVWRELSAVPIIL